MEQMTVARFLEIQFTQCGKSQTEIAKELGYRKPNILSMMKKGETKLPLDMVGPMARVLNADPMYLLRLTMSEYTPGTWASIEQIFGETRSVSREEMRLIEMKRKTMQGRELDLDDPRVQKAAQAFLSEQALLADSQEQASIDRYNASPANARSIA